MTTLNNILKQPEIPTTIEVRTTTYDAMGYMVLQHTTILRTMDQMALVLKALQACEQAQAFMGNGDANG